MPSKEPKVQLSSPIHTHPTLSWPRDLRDRVPAVLGRLRLRDANDPDVISGGLGLEPPLKRDRKWLAKADFRNLDLPATHCPSRPRSQSRGYLLLVAGSSCVTPVPWPSHSTSQTGSEQPW